MHKIRTSPNPLRRALWRFDSLCHRHQWVPLAGVALCALVVNLIAGVAP